MVVQHLFRGNALNAVDAKGRLSVPAFIRQKIERRSDEKVIVLAPHEIYPCLVGYDTNYDAVIYEENERRRLRDEDGDPRLHYERAERAFAAAEEAPYDTSGRIILPTRMRKLASLEDLALFVGDAGTFNIWNPQLALKHAGAHVKGVAADLLEERGAGR